MPKIQGPSYRVVHISLRSHTRPATCVSRQTGWSPMDRGGTPSGPVTQHRLCSDDASRDPTNRRRYIHCLVALVGVAVTEQGAVSRCQNLQRGQARQGVVNWKPKRMHHERMTRTICLPGLQRPHGAWGAYPFSVYTRITSRTFLEGILACVANLAPLLVIKAILAMKEVRSAWAH